MSSDRTTHPSAADAAFRYDFVVDPASDSTHAKILRLIPDGSRVLELGTATGYLSEQLALRGCKVVGVEADPEMAERAAQHCSRMLVTDIDALDFKAEFADEEFDIVLAADVLEHLKNPLKVLREVKSLLAPSGDVVVSLPNIAHGSVRLALFSGDFTYRERGLLDRTHLHFFTPRSAFALLDDAGFLIRNVVYQRTTGLESEVDVNIGAIPETVTEALANDDDASIYQIILRATSVPFDEIRPIQEYVRRLVEAADDAAIEIAALSASSDQLRAELDRVTGQSTQAQQELAVAQGAARAAQGREAELGRLLIEAHDSLLERDRSFSLLLRDAEALRSEADRARSDVAASQRQAHDLSVAMEHHRREEAFYRLRLERIQSSPAVRLWSMAKRAPGLRRIASRREEAFRATIHERP